MRYVKPINITDNLKVGTIVPTDGIEICKFNTNVDKTTSTSSVSSNSEKNLSQSKLAKLHETKTDMSIKDNSVFSSSKEYSDELGYNGVLDLKSIEWLQRVENTKAHKQFEETIVVNSLNDVKRSISKTIDGYYGTLTLSKIEVLSETTTSYDVKLGEINKLYSMLSGADVKAFSTTINKKITIDSIDYVGTLYKNKTWFTSFQNEYTISTKSAISGKVNGQFPSTIVKDGITYFPTGEYISKTVETWVKHYGIVRYWGGGSSRSNNYYGDPDYRYNVDGWTAKGHMNGRVTPTLNKYGHDMKMTVNSIPLSKQRYPFDIGGYWNGSYGIRDGILWTYDTDEAAKYGGIDGATWMSDYWNKSGGVWPPPGYSNDYIGNSHWSNISPGSASPLNHTQTLFTKPGAQKTSLAGFWNYGGFYCKWFRDVVMFYKGKTTTTVSEGKYEGIVATNNGNANKDVVLYTGILKSNVYVKEDRTLNYKVKCTYNGVLNKVVTKYDAKAYYEGLVYKKVFIDTTIPMPNKYMRLLVNSNNIVQDRAGNQTFKSQYVKMTNISKNGNPMLYKYIMNNKVRVPNGPKTNTFTEARYVSLIYDTNIIPNIDYLIELRTTGTTDIYTCVIYTDVYVGCTDGVYVEFVDENNIIKELMSSQNVLLQGIDYTSSTTDNINYKFTISGYGNTTTDKRNLLSVSFVAKTIDGSYTSNTVTAKISNKKYALEGEKIDFMSDYMNVSPTVGIDRLTCKELIARDNNIDPDTLDSKKFTIEVTSANSYLVDSYTDSDGNGYLYVCTYEDTGYPVTSNGTTSYTGMYKQYELSESINGIIYTGIYAVLENQNGLNILQPYNSSEYKNWYTRISYYPFDLTTSRNNTNIYSAYTMREYSSESYDSVLKAPYKNVVERAIILNNKTIKITRDNIFVNKVNNVYQHITVYSKLQNKYLTVTGIDSKEKVVTVEEDILKNDFITVDYKYVELTYEYKGFNNYHLDLNPNYLHKYCDTISGDIKPSYTLFNKTVYIFLKPTIVKNLDTNEVIINNTTKYNLYHKIDDSSPADIYDLLIGIIAVVPNSSILNTEVTRPTIIGGGIKEKYIKNNSKNLDGFYDINNYSEYAIQKHGSFVVELSNDIDQDLAKKVIEKFKPVGVLPVYK